MIFILILLCGGYLIISWLATMVLGLLVGASSAAPKQYQAPVFLGLLVVFLVGGWQVCKHYDQEWQQTLNAPTMQQPEDSATPEVKCPPLVNTCGPKQHPTLVDLLADCPHYECINN